MQWSPRSGRVVSDCNVPTDRNMTFFILHGMNTNPDPLNAWEDSHDTLDNAGEYIFKVIDDEWTKYDWDSNFTQHHNSSNFISNSTPDCVVNSTSTGNAPSKIGCTTSSIDGDVYQPLYVKSHPYEFNVGNFRYGARSENINANDAFVYINTLDKSLYPNGLDENMSYNVQGTFSAMSYTHKVVSNFVNNCYAQDVDMLLDYSFAYPEDEAKYSLTYDLIDYNASSAIVYRPRENSVLNTDKIIRQNKQYFTKEMNGSITMDLGYNFPRTNNTPINPISINMHSFSIGYSVQPTNLFVEGKNNHNVLGKLDIRDKTVNFFYGRVKPAQEHYETANESIVTPISTVIYCDLTYQACQNRGIMAVFAQTNEKNWWKSWEHDNQSRNDGTIKVTSGADSRLNHTNVAIMSEGEDKSIEVTRTSNPPLVIPVDLVAYDENDAAASVSYTDRWLIYNATSATLAPSRFYRVKFTGDSGWAGHGKTGHVVGGSANAVKNRRLEW